MKSIYLRIFLFAGLLPGLFSCEDHRMNNMVDDSVYLANFGIKEQNVYKGDGFTYPVTVIKSGAGMQGGSVTLAVNELLLAEHASQYTLLPNQYYTLKTSQLQFDKSDYRLDFDVDFDVAGIEALQASTGLEYALPFELAAAGSSLKLTGDAVQHYSILVPKVLTPSLAFKSPGLQGVASSVNPSSPPETKFHVFVNTNYHNNWNITYELQVDEAALSDYNQANETSHKLLPSDAYRIDSQSAIVPPLNNEWSFDYYLIKDKAPAGSYMLPVRISSVSHHGIDPDRSLMLIPVSIQ